MSVQQDLKNNGPEYILGLQEKYGNNFWLDGYFFAFDPEFVNDIYVKNYNKFIKAGGWHKMRKGLGEGLLTSEEPKHFKHRRILNPSFHISQINNHIQKMYEVVYEEIKKISSDSTLNVSDFFLDLSYKVLTSTLFDDKNLAQSKELKEIFYITMKKVASGEDSTPGSLDDTRARLYDFIYDVVQERIKNEEKKNDFLELLIESFQDNQISMQDVTDETISMLLAGHETTASAIAWSIYHASYDKNILDKIKIESTCFKNNLDNKDILNSIKDLYYSKYIINESLRMYPPVWYSPRQATEDCKINGVLIPKDTKVILSSYVSHRDKRYFKDPELFIPERWENDFESELPSGAYFPFHLGPRKCIGYRFGMLQAQITLLSFFSMISPDIITSIPSGVPLATYRPEPSFIINIKEAK